MSKNNKRVIAIIPAAGVGSRVGADMPKQYISIAGKSIFEYSVAAILATKSIDHCIVAVNPEDSRWRSIELLKNPKVKIVMGGAERSDSVLAALESFSATEDDWVLVHDVARPCITSEVIDNLLSELVAKTVGGILALPLTDTVKKVDADCEITETLDRDLLWRAQTPQVFPFLRLQHALNNAKQRGLNITDEASAIEQLGDRPAIVAGPENNIKVTCPADIALAEFYLKQLSAS